MCYGHDGNGALLRSLQEKGVDRRGFLRGAMATVAGAGLVVAGGGAAAAREAGVGIATTTPGRRVANNRISVQLYTLRSVMEGAGVDATLQSLAATGYEKVELAGLYGRTPQEMRRTLARLGLRASSSHDGISTDRKALRSKVAGAQVLGQRYLNVPFLESDVADDWRRWADQMNEEARVARRHGIRYGYHNHAHEFTTDLGGGLTPWDIFMERLDPALVHLELDLYWVVTGGTGVGAADPEGFAIDVIREAPHEVLQYHVKDRAPEGDFADVGTGNIDFQRIFRAHRAKEYIVENDQPDVTPLQSAEVGFRYLTEVRY